MSKNDYEKWPYRLSYSSMLVWRDASGAKGISKLPYRQQVCAYIKLGLSHHQTFEAMLYHFGGKAIREAEQALLEMSND